ncbi:MAG: helix-hairpin-helix domain-containing protein [Nitrospirae bacterium]|nr:helix-hairpin-helix domain-containing protein [Nitrospirota bacterium]
MRKSVVFGVVLAVAMGTSGCMVAKSKYDMAVEETRTTQAELETVQAQKSALEQQVKSLKDASGKLVAEAELAQAELQRLRDSRDRERTGIEGRIKEQEQKIKDLLGQQRALRQDIDGAKQRNETLKAAVARYQKELKERQRAIEPAPVPVPAAPRPPVPPTPTPAQVPAPAPATAPAIPAPKASIEQAKPQPSVAPVPTAPQLGGLAPVNVNTASANDMVLFLGLPKEVAERVVSNRPYKVRGELVARNVLPKATFDVIKDRITVTP